MNWLTNFVRPKIRAFVTRQDVPENLWHKCPSCEAMIFHRDLDESHHVCGNCGHHLTLPVDKRLALLFDEGQSTTIELPKTPVDPLKFRDLKRYSDRLREYQSRTGRSDAIVVAHGTIGGHAAVVAALDFAFMGGSMGTAVGEGIVAAANLAVLQRAPLITIAASGGARMQEGILSLMQMPRTIVAVEHVKESGLPYISVLTDPTMGGVTASFAMLGDVNIAEKGAAIGFAGARVIEETIRERLPDGFQRAEYLMDHGMVDMVVTRTEMRPTLVRLIDLLMRPDARPTVTAEPEATVEEPAGTGEDVVEASSVDDPGDAAEDTADGPEPDQPGERT